MDLAILRPSSKCFAFVPKQNSKQAPQQCKSHICHDGRDISRLNDPRRDKLAEPISPNILINGDGDEDTSRHRLVRIDCICGDDGGKCSNLDPGASVANNNNNLNIMLVSRCIV